MIKYVQDINIDEITNVVYPVIQRNAYFLHNESILVTMLSDDDQDTRSLAQVRYKVYI